EPESERSDDGDGHRFGAEAEEQPPERHDGEARRHGGEDRADEADRREPERRASGAEAIHDHTADQHHDDIGRAVDRIQRTELAVAEPELPLEQVRDRRDAVVHVVVAEHRETDEREHGPCRRGRRRREVRRRPASSVARHRFTSLRPWPPTGSVSKRSLKADTMGMARAIAALTDGSASEALWLAASLQTS